MWDAVVVRGVTYVDVGPDEPTERCRRVRRELCVRFVDLV